MRYSRLAERLPWLPRGRIAATAAWASLALGAAVTLWQSQQPFQEINPDFLTRYAAGATVAAGDDPYDRDLLFANAADALPDTERLPLFDLPPTAAVFRLLAPLPIRTASVLWTVLSLAAVALIAGYLTRGTDRRTRILALPIVLTFSPVRHALSLGQTDMVFFLPLIAACWLHEKDRAHGVALLPLGLLKPQNVAMPSVAVFLRTLRRSPVVAVVGAIAGLTALGAFSAVVAPSAMWGDALDAVRSRGGTGGRWWLVVVVTAGCAAAWMARSLFRAWRHFGPVRDWVAVAAGANGLLAVTGGWNPQWFLGLVLPLGLLLVRSRDGLVRLGRMQTVLLAVACGAAVGDAFAPLGIGQGADRLLIPGFAVAAVLAGLVLLDEIPIGPAALVLGTNLIVSSVPLVDTQRSVAPLVVGAIVVHLVLSTGLASTLDGRSRPSTRRSVPPAAPA